MTHPDDVRRLFTAYHEATDGTHQGARSHQMDETTYIKNRPVHTLVPGDIVHHAMTGETQTVIDVPEHIGHNTVRVRFDDRTELFPIEWTPHWADRPQPYTVATVEQG